MNWLNKLERKFGKYAITNLSIWLIGCYVIGYILCFVAPNVLEYLTLEPALIMKGQVWRLVTWLIIPPSGFDIFTFIMLFFYYSLGTNLERNWGSFRYNVYIFSGVVFTIFGAFLLFILGKIGGATLVGMGPAFSTYYINMSIFLAFAASYPHMKVMIYFVIPVKIKWLAYFDVAYLIYFAFIGGWAIRVVIIASILNFIVFFLTTRNYHHVSPSEIKRKRAYRKKVEYAKGITKHKCAICGRTEEDGEHLEFRFCSKCEGNYEYCQEHLFTHEHKKK